MPEKPTPDIQIKTVQIDAIPPKKDGNLQGNTQEKIINHCPNGNNP